MDEVKSPAAKAAFLLNPKAFMKQKQKEKQKDRKSTSSHGSLAVESHTHPSYDPRKLLDPKRHLSSSTPLRTLGMSSVSPSPVGDPSHSNQRQNGGSSSLLENLYGVERRQDAPLKRKRNEAIVIDDDGDDTQSKRSTSHHKGTGIIGQYLKENKAQLPASDPPGGPGIIDTADDEVQVSKVVDQSLQEVCYGSLRTKVQAHKIPKPVKGTLGGSHADWPGMACKLTRDRGQDMIIRAIDPSDNEFGRIIPETAKGLAPIMDSFSSLRTQSKLLMRSKGPNDWPGRPTSDIMNMVVNIYGLRKDADLVGRRLSQHNIWLQPPVMSDKGVPVVNPHQNKVEAKAKKFSLTSHSSNDGRTQEEALSAVSKLFDSVASSNIALPTMDTPLLLTTELMEHQRQALWWLLEREKPRTFGDDEASNSSLWRKERNDRGLVVYREIVAGLATTNEPPQVLGGLLADVMGLGKTIEILALLAATMDQAQAFGEEKMVRKGAEDANLLLNTKSTLLVSPLSAVKNWEDQTMDHMKPGSLSVYVYHGVNRTQNAYELTKYDVVITTYGTLAADLSKKHGKNVLHRLKWFRIVLDEAHTCREAKSQQAQAVFKLHATRRWALTGTPIQNRLDDLGSITQFLRLSPYHDLVGFIKYIRGPASIPGNDTFLKSLRVFVDSFSLRRLKERIDLPPRKDLIEKLKFSEGEERLHEFFKEKFNVEVEEMVRDRKMKRKERKDMKGAFGTGGYIRALQGILTLRLICAHGKELLNESNRKLLKGATKDEAIDLEDPNSGYEFDEQRAFEYLAMMASADMDVCRECLKRIGGDSPSDDDDADTIRGYMLGCNDLLCKDCFEPHRKLFDDKESHELLDCPFCEISTVAKYIPITAAGLESSQIPSDDTVKVGGKVKSAVTYEGPHTKTKALLRDLGDMYEESKEYEDKGEAPLKAIVFSEFTSHLDLIERALNDHGYEGDFVRIDGKMTLPARRKVLDALSSNNSVKILLASIKAAGQGLNLTAASRAFIMEPMWNPASEQQAVDRVHRLGQTRDVLIKRYQMEKSIEMKIMEIQRKKVALANVSMERNHANLSRKEEREAHMKDLLSMFK